MVIQILFDCCNKNGLGCTAGTGIGAAKGSVKGLDNCRRSSDAFTGAGIASEANKSTAGVLLVVECEDMVAEEEELLRNGLFDEEGDMFCCKIQDKIFHSHMTKLNYVESSANFINWWFFKYLFHDKNTYKW